MRLYPVLLMHLLIKERIMSWKFWQKKPDKTEERSIAADGIDGAEEYRLPLPTYSNRNSDVLYHK